MATNGSDSFVRWQSISLEQLGSTMNMVLGLATGFLAFQAALLLEGKLTQPWSFGLGVLALFLLAFSVALALWCAINRLSDFRVTAQIARLRETGDSNLSAAREKAQSLGKCTWRLFRGQLWFFALGAGTTALSVLIQVFHRF